jgi:hypothetical protein
MKIRYLLVVFIAFAISSCMWGGSNEQVPAINTDTLIYTYKTLKQRDPACGNKPDSECALVDIKYPEFHHNSALNDSVKHKLLTMFWSDSLSVTDTSLQKFAKDFISLSVKDTIKNPSAVYTVESSAVVERQDSSLTTIYFSGHSYAGGAHGGNDYSFINWNTKTAKAIKLTDLFIDGYNEKLTQIAEKIFRKQEKLSDTASLKENYFFKNAKFALNNNFLITPTGLIFLYNEYEIKSFAAGVTQLSIPYEQIKLLLRPNTVIAQYIK